MSNLYKSESFTQFTSPVSYSYRGLTHYTHSPHLYTVRRVSSLPEIHKQSCKPIEYPRWRPNLKEWSEWDDYWLDRRYHAMPRYTTHYGWPYRRQNYLDGPSSYWYNYPSNYTYPMSKSYIKNNYFDDYYTRRFQEYRHFGPIYTPTVKSPYRKNYVHPITYLTYQNYLSRYY